MKDRFLTADLYEYLVSLGSRLEGIGARHSAREVLHVSKFVTGSTSEFYGEARLVLPKILERHRSTLSEMDRARLREVITAIENAFARVGGA